MQVKAESLDRKLTLRLSGELDHHAARPLMQRIAQEIELALPLEVVLDFSGVTFMDSSGIGLLSGRNARIACFGGRTIVINANPRIRKLLQIAGLQDQVCIMDEI